MESTRDVYMGLDMLILIIIVLTITYNKLEYLQVSIKCKRVFIELQMQLANIEKQIRQMNFQFQTRFDTLQNFIGSIIQYLLSLPAVVAQNIFQMFEQNQSYDNDQVQPQYNDQVQPQ